ncbi:hypothetical protein FRC10_000241 [Ceratobasidium sp. 414]|nr:hypothetical protein FRC10_000241 [Ceratobasidium sp. 414]
MVEDCRSNKQDKLWDAEEALQLALKDVLEDKMSQRAAAKLHGVPQTTLGDRLRGAQDRQSAHEHEQHLTPTQEKEIVAWCAEMERQFLPVRVSHIRAYAEAILHKQAVPGAEVKLGEHWVDRFQARNPELRVVTSKQIDQKWVMAKNPTNIMDYYVKLSNIFDTYNIPPAQRFNCDEKGWQIGMTGREKVFIVQSDLDAP